MKLPTAKEMQELDRCAIETFGIPGIVLMENAGGGTVRLMEKELGTCRGTFACIFVGPGNNGGDGLVIGRHLHQLGCRPIFFLLTQPDNLSGDAATNMEIVRNLRLPYHVIDSSVRVSTVPVLFKQIESQGLPCYAIVDALFGTGLTRDVSAHFAETIKLINNRSFAHNVPVVAVDCPSGMNADTGKQMGTCIRADITATYGLPKPGHFLQDSRELTGKLEVIEIGIPPEAQERVGISNALLDSGYLNRISPLFHRQPSTHKGNYGHLLIVAGSVGKTGAAMLSGRGALRGGAGLVTLAVPKGVNTIIESGLWEAMTVPLDGSEEQFTEADVAQVLQLAEDKKAVVIGPGIGTDRSTSAFVLELYRKLPVPLVVDADAINILAANPAEIRKAQGIRIFTPHPGELSRLIGWSTDEIQGNRLKAAHRACELVNSDISRHIVIIKGAGTIISQPGEPLLLNTSGNPGMATGGMGDVLSGIIGALLCQGFRPMEAAAAGTFLHGAAADRLYQQRGVGYTASEVADMLPLAIREHIVHGGTDGKHLSQAAR